MNNKLIQFIQKYDLISNIVIVLLLLFFIDFNDFYSKKNWFWQFFGCMLCVSIGFQLYRVFKKK